MSGFQFVHVQQFSRKAIAGKAGSDGVTRGGRASVRDVMAEAAREDGAALHVDHPRRPVLVHGLNPAGVERVHDERVELARTEVTGGKPRKVRQDQATLLTVIASFPATVAECEADPVKARERDLWQARNVAWLQAEFGASRVVCVIRHDDESHPHLHAYLLPDDPSMRANALHPGWVAKQETKAGAEVSGLDPKAANLAGDRAYREAMRAFQDRYWEAVGLPSGLARVGPARRRLTRDAWQVEQAQVGHVATAIAAAAAAQESVELAKGVRAEVVQDAGDAARRQHAAEARVLAIKDEAHAVVAAAKERASVVLREADRVQAEAAVLRRQAASTLRDAKAEARRTVQSAGMQAERLRTWGARLGGLWSGLAGVQRRLERRAAEQVAAAKAGAAAQVELARVEIRAELRGEVAVEVSALRRDAADGAGAVSALKGVRVDLNKSQRLLALERAQHAETAREKESFRSRWSEADNALQARGAVRRR